MRGTDVDQVPILQETVQDLVGKYPELFQELTDWLLETDVWGYFQIHRAGREPVGHEILRSIRYEKARIQRSPVR